MVSRASSPRLILALAVLALGSSSAFAKRPAPKDVPPVMAGGIRYTAPARDGGGYVEARDVRSGKLLWELRVYEIKIDQNLERDVQDIFITSLKVADGKLQVVNEKGDKFVVDLSKRKVIQGAGRVYRFDERSDLKLPLVVSLVFIAGLFLFLTRRARRLAV
jgi:hypothetical protein